MASRRVAILVYCSGRDLAVENGVLLFTMITITYFGVLKQLQPSGSETLAWSGGTTDDLLSHLRQRGAEWEKALQPGRVFKLALNQQLLNAAAPIKDGDEVAILPPVTGG